MMVGIVLGFVLNLRENPLNDILLFTGFTLLGYTLWSQELSKP
jgi:hypothetical protein